MISSSPTDLQAGAGPVAENAARWYAQDVLILEAMGSLSRRGVQRVEPVKDFEGTQVVAVMLGRYVE